MKRAGVFEMKAVTMNQALTRMAWIPFPPGLDAEMERFNAVFTGIKPISGDECYLIYCAVCNPVDFDHILLADPLANALKEHCRQLYNEIFAGMP